MKPSVEVFVIGCGTICWSPPYPCSCYLLQLGEQTVLLDIGCGALAAAFSYESNLDLRKANTLVLSHINHPDHVGDLAALLFSLNFLPGEDAPISRQQPLDIIGPAGTEKFVQSIYQQFPSCVAKSMSVSVKEIFPPEHIFLPNGAKMMSAAAVHGNAAALCIRTEFEGRIIAYSGDTTLCPGLEQVLEGADLAIVECSYSGKYDKRINHLRASEVGEAARKAGVKKLLLTHCYPFTPASQLKEEVCSIFGGDVELARPGMKIVL